jgi:hypothetical protein
VRNDKSKGWETQREQPGQFKRQTEARTKIDFLKPLESKIFYNDQLEYLGLRCFTIWLPVNLEASAPPYPLH